MPSDLSVLQICLVIVFFRIVLNRGIWVTTIKLSPFIPPGQDYCAKDSSVGEVAECKLNELGSILIPWGMLDFHVPFYPVGNGVCRTVGKANQFRLPSLPSTVELGCRVLSWVCWRDVFIKRRCLLLISCSVCSEWIQYDWVAQVE
jgi:hypothetical protein